jgi:hypothetical protein
MLRKELIMIIAALEQKVESLKFFKDQRNVVNLQKDTAAT